MLDSVERLNKKMPERQKRSSFPPEGASLPRHGRYDFSKTPAKTPAAVRWRHAEPPGRVCPRCGIVGMRSKETIRNFLRAWQTASRESAGYVDFLGGGAPYPTCFCPKPSTEKGPSRDKPGPFFTFLQWTIEDALGGLGCMSPVNDHWKFAKNQERPIAGPMPGWLQKDTSLTFCPWRPCTGGHRKRRA